MSHASFTRCPVLVVFSQGSLFTLACLPVLVQDEGWSLDGMAKGEVIKKVDISWVQPVLKEALDNLWEGGESATSDR